MEAVLDFQFMPGSSTAAARQRKRTRLGASLLEVSIWLVIFVAIVGGVLALAAASLSQNAAAQEIQKITSLAGGAVKVRPPKGYSEDEPIDASLAYMGLIPANVQRDADNDNPNMRNSWGGAITLAPVGDGAGFSITYENIPKDECIKMVSGVQQGVLYSVAGVNIVDLSPSTAASSICTTSSNTVTWSSLPAE